MKSEKKKKLGCIPLMSILLALSAPIGFLFMYAYEKELLEYLNDENNNQPFLEQIGVIDQPTTNTIIEQKTIQDIEGNSYKTIKLGSQWWMTENLQTTKYNDGTSIHLVLDFLAWVMNKDTAMMTWCDYDSTKKNNGGIYNFYAVDPKTNGKKNVCPTGWHIPNNMEWEQMLRFINKDLDLGKEQDNIGWKKIGRFLKSKEGWVYNSNGNDLYHFSGYPITIYSNKQSQEGLFAYWWTSDVYRENIAYVYHLKWADNYVYKEANYKYTGSCIRCIQN